jgi:ribosomal-protein-alanine N-acetyltransferase
VAVCGDRLAGFLVAREIAEDEREILNVAVVPEFRRRGIARTLVRSFLDGFQGVVFLEVRASNRGARELYKSLGFQDVTLRKDYYDFPPETGVVMKFRSC